MEEIKVAYCRVSTEHEEQESSLKNQQTYYRSKGIDTIYADKGLTGTSINRPQFLQMLKDAGLNVEKVGKKLITKPTYRAPKFNTIYCKSISRFSRNVAQAIDIIRDLSNKGVYVFFEDIGRSTKDPNTSLLLNIMLSVSQAESETISQRVKWGNKQTANNGRIRSLNLFGYIYQPNSKSLIINQEEARIVQYIFSLRLKGNGARVIANTLNKEGYTTKTGKQWKPHYINRILHNKTYCGYVIRNKSSNIDIFSGKRKSLNPVEYIETKSNNVPIIIPEEDFNKVQELIEKNTEINGRKIGVNQGKTEYSNKIVCSKCNSFYISNKAKRKYGTVEFYNCGNKKRNGATSCNSRNVYKSEIDNKINYYLKDGRLQETSKRVVSIIEDTIGKAKFRLNAKRNMDNVERVKELTKEVEDIERRKGMLVDLYLDGELNKEIYISKKNALEDRISSCRDKITELSKTEEQINKDIEYLDSLLYTVKVELGKVPYSISKEELLDKYISHIVVSDRKIIVVTKFNMIARRVNELLDKYCKL